ncbi:hypothetical protein [Rubrivirga sp.]|uniref:hypothetical protein n=1 Tax=Rubrivirga sp. TaxID=1885344 RepID=UPI003C72B674
MAFSSRRASRLLTALTTVSIAAGALGLLGFLIQGETIFCLNAGAAWAGILVGIGLLARRPN